MGIRSSLNSLVSRPMEGAIRDMIEEVLASRSFVRPGEVAGLRQEIAALRAGGSTGLEERVESLEAHLEALHASLDKALAARPAPAVGQARPAGDRGCVVDGCKRTHRARGFCAKHYQMFRRSTLPGYVGPDGVVPFEGAASWTVEAAHAGKAAALVEGVVMVDGDAVEAVQIGA